MSKKNIKKLIIVLSIILVILIVMLCSVYFSKDSKAKRNIEKINNLDKTYSDYIIPSNRSELIDSYNGRVSFETMYTLIYQFALDRLPELRKENITDSEKYFKKNQEYIFLITGIDNYDEFKVLIDKINELPENLTLKETKIKENSVKSIYSGTKAVLTIYYNEDVEIDIDIKVDRSPNSERTSVTFK